MADLFQNFKFLDLTIAITDKQLLLFPAVALMQTLKVSLHSLGQRGIILNLNTLLQNTNTRTNLKKIDALMVSRRALPEEMLELLLLSQSVQLETKSQLLISTDKFKRSLRQRESHLLLMRPRLVWAPLERTGPMNTGISRSPQTI